MCVCCAVRRHARAPGRRARPRTHTCSSATMPFRSSVVSSTTDSAVMRTRCPHSSRASAGTWPCGGGGGGVCAGGGQERERGQQQWKQGLGAGSASSRLVAGAPLVAQKQAPSPHARTFIALTAFFLSLGVPHASAMHAARAPSCVCATCSSGSPLSDSTASAATEAGANSRNSATSLRTGREGGWGGGRRRGVCVRLRAGVSASWATKGEGPGQPASRPSLPATPGNNPSTHQPGSLACAAAGRPAGPSPALVAAREPAPG